MFPHIDCDQTSSSGQRHIAGPRDTDSVYRGFGIQPTEHGEVSSEQWSWNDMICKSLTAEGLALCVHAVNVRMTARRVRLQPNIMCGSVCVFYVPL